MEKKIYLTAIAAALALSASGCRRPPYNPPEYEGSWDPILKRYESRQKVLPEGSLRLFDSVLERHGLEKKTEENYQKK